MRNVAPVTPEPDGISLSFLLPVGFPVWITSLHGKSLRGRSFRLLGRLPGFFIKGVVIPIDTIDQDIKAALTWLTVDGIERVDAIITEEFAIEGCAKPVLGYECSWEPRV